MSLTFQDWQSTYHEMYDNYQNGYGDPADEVPFIDNDIRVLERIIAASDDSYLLSLPLRRRIVCGADEGYITQAEAQERLDWLQNTFKPMIQSLIPGH